MRMLLLAAASSLALAGCTTTDPVTGETTQIESVQSAVTAGCQFLPTAETVADIIATGDPRLTTASAIARASCTALAPAAPTGIATLFKAPPTVNGVVIRGVPVSGEGGDT